MSEITPGAEVQTSSAKRLEELKKLSQEDLVALIKNLQSSYEQQRIYNA